MIPRLFRYVFAFVMTLPVAVTAAQEIVVKADFPGASIHVESIDQENRVIRFTPAIHPDLGLSAWWYFKLEGLQPGSVVTLDVGDKRWARPDQPQFSHDNRTWHLLEKGDYTRERTRYQYRVTNPEVWLAWGPPFRLQESDELIAITQQADASVEIFELARTLGGRPVKALRFPCTAHPDKPDTPPRQLWVQARQHAWESGSSWVAQGLIEWLISNDPAALALRNRAVVTIVPIMDVDNVEIGAGGKNRKPRDHYWDWDSSPRFPEVRAAIQQLRNMDEKQSLDLFIDLHNPGPYDREIYFYVPAQPLLNPMRASHQTTFLALAREELTGPMGFKGKLGRIGTTYDPTVDTACDCWVAHHCRGSVLALTMETPWNTPHSTQTGYRETGRQLARTIARYVQILEVTSNPPISTTSP